MFDDQKIDPYIYHKSHLTTSFQGFSRMFLGFDDQRVDDVVRAVILLQHRPRIVSSSAGVIPQASWRRGPFGERNLQGNSEAANKENIPEIWTG